MMQLHAAAAPGAPAGPGPYYGMWGHPQQFGPYGGFPMYPQTQQVGPPQATTPMLEAPKPQALNGADALKNLIAQTQSSLSQKDSATTLSSSKPVCKKKKKPLAKENEPVSQVESSLNFMHKGVLVSCVKAITSKSGNAVLEYVHCAHCTSRSLYVYPDEMDRLAAHQSSPNCQRWSKCVAGQANDSTHGMRSDVLDLVRDLPRPCSSVEAEQFIGYENVAELPPFQHLGFAGNSDLALEYQCRFQAADRADENALPQVPGEYMHQSADEADDTEGRVEHQYFMDDALVTSIADRVVAKLRGAFQSDRPSLCSVTIQTEPEAPLTKSILSFGQKSMVIGQELNKLVKTRERKSSKTKGVEDSAATKNATEGLGCSGKASSYGLRSQNKVSKAIPRSLQETSVGVKRSRKTVDPKRVLRTSGCWFI